jgi:adenosylhomocysteine nucleosidase
MVGRLNIVVAFSAEARFFLDKYRLTRVKHFSKFPLYANKESNIHLIVSGIGKIRSAAAVGYLHAWSGGCAETTYLNAGIAGALDLEIGEMFLAHKIVDAGTAKAFYPLVPVWDKLKSQIVLTVEKPTKIYPPEGLVEMEAAGFHAAALNMVTQEQIQTLKIISDNAAKNEPDIKSQQIQALFEKNEAAISQLIDFLLKLSDQESQNQLSVLYFDEFLQKNHFTESQRYQLQELLRRWQINFPGQNPLSIIKTARNAKEIMAILEHHLAVTWI